MRVFLDTNVVLDFCAEREEFFRPAAIIFQLGREGKVELVASATTFINSFYILRREYSHDELYDRLKSIANSCTVSPADANVIKQAFDNVYPDFEDAVQYFSAKALETDIIITRNKDDFTMAEDGMVLTPEEFLDSFFQSQANGAAN